MPLAAWSTVGDLIDCGMQQVVHQISTVEGGSQTLAVVGYIPNKLIATVKDFSKDIAKKYLPKEYYQNLSEFYHGLPDNTKVTLNLFTDGLILQGAGSALKIGLTSPVPAAIQYIPHKPGISSTPSAMLAIEGGSSNPLLAIKGTTSGIGEISAISEVGKTGATLGNKISMVGGIFEEVEGLGNSIENVGSRSIWSSRPDATVVENAFSHWKRHGKNFSDTYNAKQYIEFVKNFIDHPPPNTLEYIRCNGEKIFYNPDSNIFIATTVDGVPKTMMKPKNKLKYWENKIKENK